MDLAPLPWSECEPATLIMLVCFLMKRAIFLKSIMVGFIVATVAAIDAWLRNRNVTDALVPIGLIVGFYALLAFVIATVVAALFLIAHSHKLLTHKVKIAVLIILIVAALLLLSPKV
jgi:hypothetical protein